MGFYHGDRISKGNANNIYEQIVAQRDNFTMKTIGSKKNMHDGEKLSTACHALDHGH